MRRDASCPICARTTGERFSTGSGIAEGSRPPPSAKLRAGSRGAGFRCFHRHIGLVLEAPAERPAGLERNAERDLEAVRGLERDDEALRFPGVLDRPFAETEDVARLLAAGAFAHRAREEVRQGHGDGLGLLERKLHGYRDAGFIREAERHGAAVAGHLARGQSTAADPHDASIVEIPDPLQSKRIRDLVFCLSMILSENRSPLFGIMLDFTRCDSPAPP